MIMNNLIKEDKETIKRMNETINQLSKENLELKDKLTKFRKLGAMYQRMYYQEQEKFIKLTVKIARKFGIYSI